MGTFYNGADLLNQNINYILYNFKQKPTQSFEIPFYMFSKHRELTLNLFVILLRIFAYSIGVGSSWTFGFIEVNESSKSLIRM